MRGFPVEVSAEAATVHEAALVIDLHNDLLTKLTHMPGYDFSRAHAPATFYSRCASISTCRASGGAASTRSAA